MRSRPGRRLTLLGGALLSFATGAHALAGQTRGQLEWPSAPTGLPIQAGPSIAPGNAALRSALIPGAGQLALGQNRSWVYLGLELIGWGVYVDR